MQQSSLDYNYDALVNKPKEIHEVHCPKKKQGVTEKRSLCSHVVKLRDALTKPLSENEKEA
jgi:hypothetical protein